MFLISPQNVKSFFNFFFFFFLFSTQKLRKQFLDDSTDTSPLSYRSVHRRKTDLMPTIPSPRDTSFGSKSSLYHTPRTPGKQFYKMILESQKNMQPHWAQAHFCRLKKNENAWRQRELKKYFFILFFIVCFNERVLRSFFFYYFYYLCCCLFFVFVLSSKFQFSQIYRTKKIEINSLIVHTTK